MKKADIAMTAGAGLIALAIIFTVWWLQRQFSAATVATSVVEVEPGVRCARLITGDGVAISCWEVSP